MLKKPSYPSYISAIDSFLIQWRAQHQPSDSQEKERQLYERIAKQRDGHRNP